MGSSLRRLRRAGVLAVAVGTLLYAGCATEERAAPQAAQIQQGPGKPDDFLVVDCLLPGQIRQLGRQATFLGARQAIKTSARTCEIRGGEYVAFDRANYATALKVWLPLAQQGDAAAQTYVGEIFEKGLGVPPDHAAAAEWYRRAAESGYSRAAINLGNLLEQGLGVPKDPAQALNWYRRAAGLSALTFEIVPGKTAAELQELRAQIAELRGQLQAKQAELDRAQGELEKLRRSLEERRSEADSERTALARLRRELEEQRGQDQTAAARLAELQRSIADGEARLSAKDREVAALRARAEADSVLLRSVLNREVVALREALDSERAALARLRGDLQEQRGTATARLAELQRSIADGEARLGAKDREVAALRASLGRAEADSTAQRTALDREVMALRERLARTEAESSAQRAGLERIKQETAQAGPKIELIQVQLLEPQVAAAARDIQARPPSAAAAGGPAMTVVVVGRVTTGVGLKSFPVNLREQTLDKESLFRAQVPLGESEREVRIVAVDRSDRRSTLEFLLPAVSVSPRDKSVATARSLGGPGQLERGAPRPKLSFGSYHALVIGNNAYRQLAPLRTAVNDAREVAKILREQYRFEVTLLTNANRYEILSALNALQQKLTSKDNLLIYYAGHGFLDEKNQRGHWLPIDAEPNSTANWIANSDITSILNSMNVKQLLLVADSCYSGTLTRSVNGQLEPGLTAEELFDVMRRMAQQRSRMVMTSGGVEPVLDSAGGAHSAFAEVFIQVLRENDGALLGREMFRRLQLRVAAMAERLSVPQVPEYAPIQFSGHEAGDFVFVRVES